LFYLKLNGRKKLEFKYPFKAFVGETQKYFVPRRMGTLTTLLVIRRH